MNLIINTASHEEVYLALNLKGKVIASRRFRAARAQAEKILPALDKLLKNNQKKISDLKKIQVAVKGGSFTSLRIGIITANALAYALKLPVEGLDGEKIIKPKRKSALYIVEPLYSAPPTIGH